MCMVLGRWAALRGVATRLSLGLSNTSSDNRRFRLRSVRAGLLLLLLAGALPVRAAERIMPLGDSITYGWSSSSTDGYRRALYLALTGAGHDVDFVGSLADGPQDFDRDHEGHSGWRAEQIRDNITNWLTNTPADIVLLHIGTNDISAGESAAGIAAEVAQILDNIDAYETAHAAPITVVLARIVNRNNPFDTLGQRTTAYNQALQALADARLAAGDRLVVVDQEAALTYPADMADTVHPNDGGYAKMADVWFAAVDALLAGGWVTNVTLSETPMLRQAAGELVCDHTLLGPATHAGTSWLRDDAPWMLLYLPMEGGEPAALTDFSGNALVVTKVGAPTWNPAAGHDGHGAYVFDGDESLYADEHFPIHASYTKMAWVYRTGSGDRGGNNIISGDVNAAGHAFWAPDLYANRLSAGHNQHWDTVQDADPLALNTWYHVALSFDYATGEMVLYKNGAVVDSAIVPAGDRDVTDTSITIGAFHEQVQWAWLGTIDDVRIFPFVVTPAQVAAVYASGANVIAPDETDDGDAWQCAVTPFTADAAGTTAYSNVLNVGPCVPHCDGKECGDDLCGGLCGTCGFGEVCDVGTCGLPVGPGIANLQLDSTSGHGYDSDALTCSYDLAGTATTAATAWYLDAAPLMRLFLPMEGGPSAALLDYSGNGFAVATIGTPTWSATGGHDGGGAFTFDGAESLYAGENFPTGSSYTKLAWVYRTGSGANGGNNIISGDVNAGGHAFWAPDLYSNKLSAGHNQVWNIVQDSTPLALNTWYQVAVTYDHTTGAMVLYKNGAVVDSDVVAAANRNVTDATITIGAFHNFNEWAWLGRIDDARVYPFALTPQQIAALYTAGGDVIVAQETQLGDAWQCRVTPFAASEAGPPASSNVIAIAPPPPPSASNVAIASPSGQYIDDDTLTCTYTLEGAADTAATAWYLNGTPWLRLYLPMEGGAAGAALDRSGNGWAITPGSDPAYLATSGHDGHGAMEFDGDDDLGAGEHFPTNASYTNAAWVYRTGSGANGGNNIVAGNENAGGHAFWAPDSYGNKLSAGHNGHWNTVQDGVALALNTWYHVALTYDRATGEMILYKNGVAVDSALLPAGDQNVTDATISVGSFGAANGYKWKGLLDDVRVYATALSPEQIAALYAGGAGDRDTIVPQETALSDAWQCRVTPFSASEQGPTAASAVVIIGTPVECTTNGDCTDGDPCTLDLCVADTCGFAPVDCGNQFCNPADGACVECLPVNLLDESFDAYAAGANPPDWFDTAANNSFAQDDALFTIKLVDGGLAYGTDSTATNIHAHYATSASANWTNYDLTGRMRITSASAGVGVTVFSGFPNEDRYYRLRRLGTVAPYAFHLDQHPDSTQTLTGDKDTGVVPTAGTWWRFRVQVEVTATQTIVRANVWPDGDAEPAGWQAEAFDSAPARATSGRVGLWSFSSGSKYWDDLRVVDRSASPGTCDDGNICTADVCSNFACVHPPANEGLACDDLDVCTQDDACAAGVCTGSLLDCDQDGWCDLDDNCPTVANADQANGDGDDFGDACDGVFDADHDGDVDVTDLAAVISCVSGPLVAPAPACLELADADGDGDVDLGDFAAYQHVVGPPAGSPCVP